MSEHDAILARRLWHIQDICQTSIVLDAQYETGPNHWTDRHWLAQSVLNILAGKIDEQIRREIDD